MRKPSKNSLRLQKLWEFILSISGDSYGANSSYEKLLKPKKNCFYEKFSLKLAGERMDDVDFIIKQTDRDHFFIEYFINVSRLDFINGNFRIWQNILQRISIKKLEDIDIDVLIKYTCHPKMLKDETFKAVRDEFFEKCYNHIKKKYGKKKADELRASKDSFYEVK